jgi:predicted negative regulator of RcsB-dependent stress response
MRSLFLILAAGATTATAPAPAVHDAAKPAAPAAPAATIPSAALPRFAAELAQMPSITGGDGWSGITGTEAWHQLATATPDKRQLVRWNYAKGLIASERGAEALGVLEVMRLGDKDLALVAPYQLARGAALTLLGRDAEAVESLAAPELASNPEACAWRMRALAHSGSAADAVGQINCARIAINARAPRDRVDLMIAAAGAAIDAGQPQPALQWLGLFSDQNPEANVLRGRALLAQKDMAGARLRFERATLGGSAETRAAARLGMIQVGIDGHSVNPVEAIKQLDALRFGWRGGPIEQRALTIEYGLAKDQQDLRAELKSGATLLRYFKLGAQAGPMLAELQQSLTAVLAPESKVPLAEAAGLYWDYRELAPSGGDGDVLANRLADRLQAAGLYARAAELLQYQLTQRAQDVAQGPLSVRVAMLQILAGRPDLALTALQTTEQPSYTDQMRWDRKRMEAVALHRLGKDDAAAAALDGVPDGAAVRAEIHWRTQDWGSFVTESEASLPPAKALGAPQQAAVLRYAVALAMLNRNDKLKALNGRYAAAFKGLPSASAFDVLTGSLDKIDPAKLDAAIAAIPEASPAGAIGDLLDAGG